ncbi:DUF943 family protein [Pantoea agglomerans]|uniref:DUF943 family protein n=1 Tax=Enterobacter agglomerans TaxID=549 RepID=UPI003D2BCAFE
MKVNNKKKLFTLSLAGCALLGYFIWLSVQPVEIVAVHEHSSANSVLVKSFPFTDKGKINWWLTNKEILKARYNIPKTDSDGSFTVMFWLFGEGYKETDGYDRLCFNDMNPPLNCIEKDAVFSVSNSSNLGTIFTVYNGKYQLKNNGDIIKFKDKSEIK